MKVSLNWLREFVELPPTTEALVDLLTLAGVEVEDVIHRGVAIENVVIAQIRESVQHPNADRLSVCQVEDGSGTARQIVCGAKNYRVGDKVPLALPGAVLPGDFKIKVGKLRGVESQGMLCSAKELALSEDAEGLLILAPEARIGAPIAELFPSDIVLDLEITPNRADLLSHFGIAREIAALTEKPSRVPELRVRERVGSEPGAANLTDECWFYSARRIDGITVTSSPAWLVQKLEAIGLRPINNVVDITNYVMLELGQPLHAFDAEKVRGPLHARAAADGEQMIALDGKTYTLVAGDVVIADDENIVAIAGVMGGEASGVTAQTTSIWLEAAEFSGRSVRRTSRRLGLASESSYRFERGVDWAGVLYASQRATELLIELTGGTASAPVQLAYPGATDENSVRVSGEIHFPSMPNSAEEEDGDDYPPGTVMSLVVVEPLGSERGCRIPLRPERVAALLGFPISEVEITGVLNRLGLRSENDSWWAPSTRQDLTREIDLIEEIARVIGMDHIPARVQARFAPGSASDRAYDAAMALRRALVGLGLHEARNGTLVPIAPRGNAFTQTAPCTLQRVKNPMIDDQVVLRPNLMHGLLEALARNIRAGEKSIRLFEIGRTFSTVPPEEFSHAAFVLSGPVREPSWRGEPSRDADLFDLKGIVATALGSEAAFEPKENPTLALSIAIKVAGQPVGLAGQLWPADARVLNATAPVLFAEFDLGALAQAQGGSARKHRDIPRFPAVTRDIALLAPVTLPHETIAAALTGARELLLADVELFDVFADPSGAKIPADHRSLAYSLTYRSPERTLTSDEVNAAHSRLKERLKTELGVTLRE